MRIEPLKLNYPRSISAAALAVATLVTLSGAASGPATTPPTRSALTLRVKQIQRELLMSHGRAELAEHRARALRWYAAQRARQHAGLDSNRRAARARLGPGVRQERIRVPELGLIKPGR